eukprot:321374_1
MSHSNSHSLVSSISDDELAGIWTEEAMPALTQLFRTKTKDDTFKIKDEDQMHSKALSKLKPIQRQILGEYFATTKKDPAKFIKWYKDFKGKHDSKEAILDAYHQLVLIGYDMDKDGKLILPTGVKFDAHHDLKIRKGRVEYNDWNDYDYNDYVDYQDSFYPIDQFGGYKSYNNYNSKYIDGVSGYGNYYIVLGVLVTLMLCTLGAAIACICGGTFGFIAGKFHKKQNQLNEKSSSVFEEV